VPFREALRKVLRTRSLAFVIAATAVQSLGGYSILSWGPTFLIRVHEMNRIDVGVWLGVTIGVCGSVGAFVGGRLADVYGRRDERWYMRLPAIQALLGVPFALGFLLAPDPQLALYSFIPFYLLGAMYVGPMFSMTQSLVVPQMRATASAINLFIVNMIGLGLGPLVVGFLNDLLAESLGDGAIRYSLTIVAVLGGLASILFWQASTQLREDLEAAREEARA